MKLIVALLKGGLSKLAAAWVFLMESIARLFGEGGADDALRAAALLVRTELGREWMARWLAVLAESLWSYWLLLLGLALTGLSLVAAGHLPLAWRALTARRRAVFVSFQNEHEAEARRLSSALADERFQVLRVPYAPGAAHQQIVGTVNNLLRRCHALVCLPGNQASFVDAEVSAATVAYKPVVFLVSDRGTLPNTADKRHPSFSLDRSAARGHRPVTDFLHHVTQDFRSTLGLYGAAWRHPAVAVSLSHVVQAAMVAALLLFAVALAHGHLATARLGEVPAGLAAQRWEALLMATLPLLLGGMVLLPCTIWWVLVARALWVQLRAARRAALRAASGEFSRQDWVAVMPDTLPSRAVFDAMRDHAPFAHHERLRSI